MTSWKDRKTEIKNVFDHDPLNTIPMIEGVDEPFKAMHERIKEEFDRNVCGNITIIDPYFLSSDVGLIVHMFASMKGRSVRIITKLADPGVLCSECNALEELPNKKEREKRFQQVIKEIEDKKLFFEFKVFITNKKIHDRYFISDDIDKNSPCFSLGTSINMLFKSYTNILRVKDMPLKRQISKLASICIEDSFEITGVEDDQ